MLKRVSISTRSDLGSLGLSRTHNVPNTRQQPSPSGRAS